MRRNSLTEVATMRETDWVIKPMREESEVIMKVNDPFRMELWNPMPKLNQPDNLTCTCLRCGHRWVSDTVRMLIEAGMQAEAGQALLKAPPKRCAACKSPYWQQTPIRKPNDHLGATE